jgi:hypothetical protein
MVAAFTTRFEAAMERTRKAVGQYGLMTDQRDPHDRYETPAQAVEMLLKAVPQLKRVPVLDPSAGRGKLVDALLDGGCEEVYGAELHRVDAMVDGIDFGRDFLEATSETVKPARDIVMNPPYNAADAHVRHALSIVPRNGKVCVLLRMTWIAAKKRADLLPLLDSLIMVGRLKMLPPNVPDRGFGGAVDFAWFVFRPGGVLSTRIVRAE